ncbi:serine/threonine-protein kinase [Streptomyces panaciradicis]|uniref:serine/threonine-protein kinase n=1 Tax=Streptomyces panaciradicis TaxID=1470261 RepID=UPI00201CF890|nr:serine/threonine-protein kinase [Streptomyces panaciradicis]MCL6674841.1 serine/threonine-protein kinase [Streptomyces panaciradicis]
MAPQHNAGAGAEAELPDYAGHYRLESCLGSGGMGVVHLARSTSGMKVAVKVVHAEFAKDPEFRGRFRQEVAAARRVSGAFTAPVVDADPEAGRPWMATLYIPGSTLSDHVKRNGPMDAAQLRRLMAGLAEALRDIHRVGVVHRDLKPSNVLLADDGPKVIDFGISRPKDSELRTETGKLIGTPPFMAPEQFRRPREVGPAADVFALGSVMVHAATGRGPFDSDSPYIVAYQVVHDEPDMTGVPANLAPLVLRCLAKEPEDRPTPDELMRELRSVAASYDTQAFIPAQRSAEPSTPGRDVEEPQPAPVKRGRRRRAVLVGLALAVVAGGGLAWTQLPDGDKPAAHPKAAAAPSAAPEFKAWATKPARKASGVPKCTFGMRELLCVQHGVVSALGPADGSVLWRRSLPLTGVSLPAPVVSGGLVHVLTGGGKRVEALDPSSGRTRWSLDVSADRAIRYAGGTLLLSGADGKVTGIDSASGATRWSRRIPGLSEPYFVSFPGSPLAIATTVTGDGTRTRVTAVDATTGDVRWDAVLDGGLTPVGVTGGSVVFLSVDRVSAASDTVVRYDPETKASRRVPLRVPLGQAGATVHKNLVYVLGTGGSLTVVDTHAGKQLWSLETAVSRGSAPVTDGRQVYFTAADGRLLAVDAAKGRLLGQTSPRLGTDTAAFTATLPSPQLSGPHLYASAPDGTVFSVDSRTPGVW